MTSMTVATNLKLIMLLSSLANVSHIYHLCVGFFFFLNPGAFTSVSAELQTTLWGSK